MTIGTGTYHPNAKFFFPRSFAYEFVIARYGDTITNSGFEWTIHAVPPDPTFAVIKMAESFFNWNSNGRSLDFVITDFYAKVGGTGPNVPLDFSLSWGLSPVTKNNALIFEWFTGTPDFEAFPLPSQPFGYWLPHPLP